MSYFMYNVMFVVKPTEIGRFDDGRNLGLEM